MPNDDLSHRKLDRVGLSDSNLTDATRNGSSLRQADPKRTNLTGADLSERDLDGADRQAADLTDAVLEHANVTDTDLRAANLERAASTAEATLTRAKGVPDALGHRAGASAADAGSPACERAQAEHDRQLATGEENPA